MHCVRMFAIGGNTFDVSLNDEQMLPVMCMRVTDERCKNVKQLFTGEKVCNTVETEFTHTKKKDGTLYSHTHNL